MMDADLLARVLAYPGPRVRLCERSKISPPHLCNAIAGREHLSPEATTRLEAALDHAEREHAELVNDFLTVRVARAVRAAGGVR